MILSEAFISLSYCQTFEGHDFRDSSILLYIWCMPYIGPIGSFRPRAFALVMISLLGLHFVQPLMLMDRLGQSSSHLLRTLTLYTSLCSNLSFMTHVEGFNFIPIVGLQGVTMYHLLAVMG